MFRDYHSMHMRVASHDKAVLEFDRLGRPSALPYCVINANRYFLPDARIENYLQKTDDELRGNEAKSMEDFMNRLDTNKLLWRRVLRPTSNKLSYSVLYLDHSTYSSMINTGFGDLLVGDEIFALPAISYLANNNPSVNLFSYNGSMYVHPMLLNWQDRLMLTEDMLMIAEAPSDAKPSTLIGSMFKKYVVNKEADLDATRLLTYLRLMRPVGTVVHNLEGPRRSVYDVTQNIVSLGCEFICQNHPF